MSKKFISQVFFPAIVLIFGLISGPEITFAQCGSCNLCNEKKSQNNTSGNSEKESSKDDEFQSVNGDDEFEEIVDDKTANTSADEFEEAGDEFEDVDGEEFSEAGDDEFSEAGDDEFSEAGDGEFSASDDTGEVEEVNHNSMLYWPLGALFFTLLSGILVRFINGRKLRAVFLIGSIVFLGFYNNACPCPIMSFESVLLAGFGADIPWQAMVWFLGLIPLTYLLGKVWCGWVCHLGALQELLYFKGHFAFLNGKKAQLTMRIMRYVLVAALIIQLFITMTNEFCRIDPFKAIFNLGFNLKALDESGQIIIWSLVGLLIISSLFIERPFCKAACPIGLVLGWISKIPGASVLGEKAECKSCSLCHRACQMDAITKNKKMITLDNKECIACGDCMDACKRNGIGFFRKGKKHNDVAILSNNEGIDCTCLPDNTK